MPFLPPNQQRQSTEGKALKATIQNTNLHGTSKNCYKVYNTIETEAEENSK